jgi:undecaprenyl-diphosphatase
LEIVKILILGIIQGLTEFLPISSSGHLVLVAEILNFKEEGVAFEVFVHLGTLFSVLVAFREEIYSMLVAPYRYWIRRENGSVTSEYLRWDLYIIIGSIPAAVIGLIFKEQIEAIFSNVTLVVFMLAVTGTILLISKYISSPEKKINGVRSFMIGIAQAFAILPGISRSGSTIVTALALGIEREKAAKFSFILSIPVILGATILKINDLIASHVSLSQIVYLLLGALTAFISGYFAILWLLNVVRKGKLELFAYYCYGLVLLMLFLYLLK